jgi:hypothetical protein
MDRDRNVVQMAVAFERDDLVFLGGLKDGVAAILPTKLIPSGAVLKKAAEEVFLRHLGTIPGRGVHGQKGHPRNFGDIP